MARNKAFDEKHALTKHEREVVILKSSLDMINDMVNHMLMTFSINDPHSQIMFKTYTDKLYFNVLLVDFLSVPRGFFEGESDFLELLAEVCNNPQFNSEYITPLKESVAEFSKWLEEVVTVKKRWFASIELETDIKIQRQLFITMCGNINKHNFTNQTIQAKKLQQVLRENNCEVSIDKCLLALKDFTDQFFEDVFSYHCSTIAEYLNNIRWGIYYYMVEEHKDCVVEWFDEDMKILRYKYNYPKEIISDLGKECYWELMNDMRSPPFVEKFEVTKYLKMHY